MEGERQRVKINGNKARKNEGGWNWVERGNGRERCRMVSASDRCGGEGLGKGVKGATKRGKGGCY